jgi:hypothetical protein
MAKDNSLPGNKSRGPVSKNRIYQKASSHAIEAINVLLEIMRNGDSDSNRVGAAKTVLAKCVPDLKATELSTDEQSKFIFQIIKDTTLEDARSKDTTNNSKLSKAGKDIPKSSKV